MDGKGRFSVWTWEAQDSISEPLAFVVYLTLKRFSDFNTGENCYVSDAKAAQTAGISIRTFIDRREVLKKLGWITWTSGKENGTTNLYKIHETLEGYAPDAEGSAGHAEGSAGHAEGSAPNADLGMQDVQTTKRHIYQETLPRDNTNKDTQIREIHEHWQKAMGYEDRALTDGRKKHISARLKEGFTVQQLKLVIDFAKNDPFWRGKNDRDTPYDDITNLFRNRERVERFLKQSTRKTDNNRMVITDEDRAKVKGTWFKDDNSKSS